MVLLNHINCFSFSTWRLNYLKTCTVLTTNLNYIWFSMIFFTTVKQNMRKYFSVAFFSFHLFFLYILLSSHFLTNFPGIKDSLRCQKCCYSQIYLLQFYFYFYFFVHAGVYFIKSSYFGTNNSSMHKAFWRSCLPSFSQHFILLAAKSILYPFSSKHEVMELMHKY